MAPFHGPPARILSPLFFQARSLLLSKPCGKKGAPKAAESQLSPKPQGPQKQKPHMAAVPGFKSQRQSSSAALFPTPPPISYTHQHSLFFQFYWAAIVSLGRHGWPHVMEPIISKLSHRLCNQGELLPSAILGGIRFHPRGSKNGHSYLRHP